MKITAPLFLLTSVLFASNSYAQLGGLLKDLKTLSDKVPQVTQSQQPPQAQQSQQAQQPQQPQAQIQAQIPNSTASSKIQKSFIDNKGMLHLTKSDFKNEWCKSVDNNLNAPFDYKGFRPGDLCVQPDEVINKIFIDDYAVIDSKNPRFTTVTDYFRTNNLNILTVEIHYHPSAKKIYIASFIGALCKSDPSNSLDPKNSFRLALQTKYGEPTSYLTSYDVLKAQYDELKSQIDSQRKNAITVSEAKSARDGQSQLNVVSNLMKDPNLKNQVAQLDWKYSGQHKRDDGISGMLIWEANPTERSLCNKTSDQFSFAINASEPLVNKLSEIRKEALSISAQEKKNAPVPKF